MHHQKLSPSQQLFQSYLLPYHPSVCSFVSSGSRLRLLCLGCSCLCWGYKLYFSSCKLPIHLLIGTLALTVYSLPPLRFLLPFGNYRVETALATEVLPCSTPLVLTRNGVKSKLLVSKNTNTPHPTAHISHPSIWLIDDFPAGLTDKAIHLYRRHLA